jgi:hypothetical protein
MVYRCEGDLHSDLMVENLEHRIIEILGVINCDLSRDAIVANDILLEEFFMVVELMFVMGFASTHFMKYSTATIAMV